MEGVRRRKGEKMRSRVEGEGTRGSGKEERREGGEETRRGVEGEGEVRRRGGMETE